jgi:DedD protein
MAERANATSKKTQDAAQDVSTLQKRGRRRLVGAIALVLVAVIVLPMVFDPEPKPTAPLVSVRIPSEDGGKFTPKATLTPPEPESRPAEKKAEEKAAPKGIEPAPAAAPPPEPAKPAPEPAQAEEKPAAKVAEKPTPKPAAKPAPKPLEKPAAKVVEKPVEKAAPAAPAGEQYVVQVGAFASPDKVKEITGQLAEAKLPNYTESVATAKGAVTRVRLGPFASKEAAEKARERAKALGLNPANPVVK